MDGSSLVSFSEESVRVVVVEFDSVDDAIKDEDDAAAIIIFVAFVAVLLLLLPLKYFKRPIIYIFPMRMMDFHDTYQWTFIDVSFHNFTAQCVSLNRML